MTSQECVTTVAAIKALLVQHMNAGRPGGPTPPPPGPDPGPPLPDPPRQPEDPQPIQEPPVIPPEIPNPVGDPPPGLPKLPGPGRKNPVVGAIPHEGITRLNKCNTREYNQIRCENG